MNSNGSHRISGLSPTDSGCSHYFHSVVNGCYEAMVDYTPSKVAMRRILKDLQSEIARALPFFERVLEEKDDNASTTEDTKDWEQIEKLIGKINGLVANFNGVESSSPLPRIGEGVEQTQIVTDLERLKSTVIMRQNLYSPTRHCCTCL